MGLAESIEEAKDAAREWRAVREMPAPRLGAADALPVHLVEVRTVYEGRTLENDVEPVPPGSPLRDPSSPDPWSIDVEVPPGDEAWTTRVPLPDTRGVVTCFVCKGSRSFSCDDCGGSGKKRVEEYEPITGITRIYYVPCGTCAGTGTIRCDTCRGSALVGVTRCVVVEKGVSTRCELEHGGRLAPEVAREILGSGSATPLGASVLREVRDPSELSTGALPPRVDAMVRAELARADTAERRTRARSVRVVAGWIVELKLPDRALHVWGDPPRVAGDDAPVASGRALVWVAVGVAALGVVGAALYFLQDL
jgi:hypothetical protein